MEFDIQSLEELLNILKDKRTRITGKYVPSDIPEVTQFDRLCSELPKTRLQIVPNVLSTLKQCLMKQDNTSAIMLINYLAEKPVQNADTVHRAALELIFRDPLNNKDIMSQLVHQMRWLSEINVQELVLEYVFFLLRYGERSSVKESFQMVPKTKGKVVVNAENLYMDTVFKAYQGLVWYVEWKAAKVTAESYNSQLDLEDLLMSQESSSINFEEVMKLHAQKSLAGFQALIDKPGVWDIFISKHVEILEYYGKKEEAEAVLKQYRERNPENPNSHKYLYEFLLRSEAPKGELAVVLKGLAEHVPSDALVLQLSDMLMEDKQYKEVIENMFHILDYEEWKMMEKPWQLFSQALTSVYVSGDQQAVKCLFQSRCDWWPEYHFSIEDPPHCMETPVCRICQHKSLVADFLLGKENEFTKITMEFMDDTQRQMVFSQRRLFTNLA